MTQLWGRRAFFFARASGLVSSPNLLPGEHCPLRIPVLRKKRPEDLAAVSPRSKCGRDSALSTVAKEKPSCPLLLSYYILTLYTLKEFTKKADKESSKEAIKETGCNK